MINVEDHEQIRIVRILMKADRGLLRKDNVSLGGIHIGDSQDR